MEYYNRVIQVFEENKCKILTSYEEYEEKRKQVLNNSGCFVRVDFIASCGHPCNVAITNFILRKTGLLCKECTKQKTYSTLINRDKLHTQETEYMGINILNKYISKYYEIIRTSEGCLADLAIKLENNSWLPIQIKTVSNISHNMYTFRKIKESYKDMLLICICISEEKIWIIPYNELNIKCSNLNISNKSKYNIYLCNDNNNINLYINKYSQYTQSLNDILIPINSSQKKEQDYIQKRKQIINFLIFTDNQIQGTPTDFFINNKKIQEKVTGILNSRNCLLIEFSSNNGKNKEGKRQFRTYKLGENDFYWINSSIDDRFWIIPEIELYNRKYVSSKDEICKKTRLTIKINNEYNYNDKEWLKEYEYNYNTIDMYKSKLISLFQ